MNKQRKILITVIYNDLGIIVDTKAEEFDLSANLQQTCNKLATDTISRQAAVNEIAKFMLEYGGENEKRERDALHRAANGVKALPSAQPERLTDDDFETIRIHLSAFKEQLCNQHRWKEAEEYQQLIDRFMSFASAQPDPLSDIDRMKYYVCCPMCDLPKCVKGAPECEAEQWAQARRKEN